jgi:hypothetical protein
MSLPPLIGSTITATPSSGIVPLRVSFSGGFAYDAIEETTAAADTITESGSQDDTITES